MPVCGLHESHKSLFLGVNPQEELAKLLGHQKGDISGLGPPAHWGTHQYSCHIVILDDHHLVHVYYKI